MKVGVIVGSLRREGNSRKLAQRLQEIAPASFEWNELAIGDLPLYNMDREGEAPAEWARFREGVRSSDGLIFITPEYNRSIPGAVKNAIDVASKPNGQNLWPGKKAFVVAQSNGPLGGLAGSFALKQTLAGAGALVLPHPEVYLSRISTLFGEDGRLVPDTQEFLRGVLATFDKFIRGDKP
ncbi:NADPH-dependent FMN reductase [Ramlibacter sp. PS4R-6]|uniref:NADPH-dependent FMN reductase n=1 Tax=Ramlibacter sp. PS4R-6 TaxID=3133438 RepID=UPI0030AA49A8